MIDDLIERLNLTLIEKIEHGRRCKSVFRVRDRLNQSLVLKASDNPGSFREISANIRGYEKLASLGLGFFIPHITAFELSDTCGYILMEDCGTDLGTQIRNGSVAEGICAHIAVNLLRVYKESLRTGSDAYQYMEFEMATVKSIYRDFAGVGGSMPLDQVERTLERLLKSLHMPEYCFASWDFIPWNIFASQDILKFADPPEMVTGMPIVDLACFGGVLQDVFEFPAATDSPLCFREFALGPVAATLSLSRRNAQAIYVFGRLLQALLHLREYHSRPNISTAFNKRIQLQLQQLVLLKE